MMEDRIVKTKEISGGKIIILEKYLLGWRRISNLEFYCEGAALSWMQEYYKKKYNKKKCRYWCTEKTYLIQTQNNSE